jgi:hypothetical protein
VKMIKTFVIANVFLLVSLVCINAPAFGAFVQIPIGSLANANIRSYTGGGDYPIAPTTLTAGGVDFLLEPQVSVPDSLGALQLDAPGTSFTIATNVVGAATVYTLINSGFGAVGADNASIEFVAVNGADATFDLVQGDNIRDHFQNVFNNDAPNTVPTLFASDRLDRQTFVLPSSFATDTLTKIIFTAKDSGVPQGEAFLAALTVATVPEPSTLVMLVIAAAVIRLRRR